MVELKSNPTTPPHQVGFHPQVRRYPLPILTPFIFFYHLHFDLTLVYFSRFYFGLHNLNTSYQSSPVFFVGYFALHLFFKFNFFSVWVPPPPIFFLWLVP